MLEVKVMANDSPLWDRVDSSVEYSIYHKKAWESVVEKTFGHRGMYISVQRDKMLLDVLPAFLVEKPFLGKKLVSTPYEGCNGGFSCSDLETRKAIIQKVLETAGELNVKYVEIRSSFPISELSESGFIEQTPLLITELTLGAIEKNWMMLSSKHRRNVRSAEKRGVIVKPASQLKNMETFYRILSRHYKDLGLPFFSKKFFIQIWKQLEQKGHATLLLAQHEEEIIGGHLLFYSGKTLVSKYSAVKKEDKYSTLYASYALFWEGIKLGISNGFEKFNFGVTGESNSGLIDFKSRFGAETYPVYFYYYPIKGKIPDFAKYYSGYSVVKRIWRATPAIITSPIGQKINEWVC